MYEQYTPHVTINRDPLSRAVAWSVIVTGAVLTVSIVLGWFFLAVAVSEAYEAMQSLPFGGFTP